MDGVGLVGVSCMSNVLGTINDLGPIVAAAHAAGAVVVADGSQLVPHRSVDVAALGSTSWPSRVTRCSDRQASACCGAARSCWRAMPPFLGGGEMIRDVRLDGFIPNELPWKFEAGTPPIAEAIGLHAAISLPRIGRDGAHHRARVRAHP